MYCTLSTSDTPDDNACWDRSDKNGFYKLLFLYNRREEVHSLLIRIVAYSIHSMGLFTNRIALFLLIVRQHNFSLKMVCSIQIQLLGISIYCHIIVTICCFVLIYRKHLTQ